MQALASPTGREEALRAIPRPDGSAPRALVLGGTGYIGGRLVPRLLNAGYRVRVLARDARERLPVFEWGSQVEGVSGAAEDPEVIGQAVDDVDVLFYLVHSMAAGKGFEDADRVAAETAAEAAARASVARIVYLGGLHPEGERASRPGVWGEASEGIALSQHLRSRVEVGEIFLRSGVPTVVLQAGVVIGSGSASFEMVRHLTEILPYMPAPKWVRNFIQPIAVRDVLYYLLGAARVDAGVNRAVDIGGPDVLRYGQMMNGYAVEAGLHQRPIASLPVLTPRLASHWVNLVTPIPRSIARPLVESLQHDCVMKNHDIDELVPLPEGGLTPYRRAVQLAVGRVEADAVETSWQDTESGMPSDPLPNDPDWAGRTVYTDIRTAHTSADAEHLWAVIQGIGGQNGWYSSPLLWAIRGWMDKLVGGVGLQRGRRSRANVTIGDAVDFWRVETIEPGQLLRLRAEMKTPGGAWLELRATPEGEGSRYDQRAVFFPRGLAGRLYWLAVLPFHGFIFNGMANRITAKAEATSQEALESVAAEDLPTDAETDPAEGSDVEPAAKVEAA